MVSAAIWCAFTAGCSSGEIESHSEGSESQSLNTEHATNVDLEALADAEIERHRQAFEQELESLRPDPWFQEPPADYEFGPDDSMICYSVRDEKLAEAKGLLRERVAVELSRPRARTLLKRRSDEDLANPVLVRSFGTPNSLSDIRLRQNHAIVRMSYLGSFQGATRRPCIADLPRIPEQLVFSLSGAA